MKYSDFRKFMDKNCKEKPSKMDLEKEANDLYVKKQADEEKLLSAFEQKKLKSKSAIAKAKAIKKAAAAAKQEN